MSFLTALRRLYALLPPSSRRQVVPLLFLMLCNAFSEVTGVAGLLPFAAVASDPTLIHSQSHLRFLFETVGSPDPHLFLVYLGAAFLVLLITMNLLNMATFWFSLHFSFHFGSRLSGTLLSSYLSRPYLWFLQRNNGNLANLVLSEIDALSETIVLSTAELLTMSFLTVFLVAGLLWVDPLVAITTTLLLLLVYGQVYRIVRLHLNHLGDRRMALNAERHRATDDALNAVKEARSFGQANMLSRNYADKAERYCRLRVLERLVAELPKYATETLGVASLGMILIYLVFQGHSSQHAIPLVCLYIMATWRLVPALQMIYCNSTRVCFHAPVLELIANELQGARTLESEGRGRLLLRDKISLNSASFTYPGSRESALGPLSLEIKRGAVVAMVGRTGSGKTTLAEILAGLLPLDAGCLEIDGQLVERENHLDWLRNVGYVPQEIFLTDSTVACNVALGYPPEQIDMEAVARAVRTARLADFVETELPEGYETSIGERGVSLSGGQRQRLGIARALYSDPEFLIMDEATSALDNLTAREVMEAISELAGKKTVVFIAHRLATVQLCQQVYLLEHGHLVAQGTYAELVQSSPQFRQLAETELKS